MPTYDVRCPKCGKVFEIFVKMEDRDKHVCETCNEVCTVQPAACWAVWLTDTGTASNGRMTR